MDLQDRVLALCRQGRPAEAFALAEPGLRRVRERASALLKDGASARAAFPLFACGEYEPRRVPSPSRPAGNAAGLGCSYSEAILRLKALRDRARFERSPGSVDLGGVLAVRLARGLRSLRRAGALGPGAPVLVAPVPGAKAGPPAFGLCHVVERACALAGAEFAFRVLLLRGLDLPPAHLASGPRQAGPHLASLLPLRERAVGGRAVVLVDDVVSSGSTLRASAALVALRGGASRVLGLSLARTRAARVDGGAVRLV